MTQTASWIEQRITARELRIGDHIVLQRNRIGTPTRVCTVGTLVYGEGCKGMHVNPKYGKAPANHPTPGIFTSMLVSCDGCYDSAALIDVVRFPEDAHAD